MGKVSQNEMDHDLRPTRALEAAIVRLVRPLARLMLRHGVPFAVFEESAKRAFVEAAMTDFALPGRKPSASRASILTGLTRKDVQRLRSVAEPADESLRERRNRAARVVSGWVRDADFLDERGGPRALPVDGDLGFAALVRRYSGDMPARAVLDELLRVGAVRQRDDGLYEPLARAYVPAGGTLEKVAILGQDVADLIATIDHNLEHGDEEPRFQRKVMYHSIPVDVLPAFRQLAAGDAQALLERLDRWLAAHDDDAPAQGPDVPRARVGLGIHYFEEPLGPAPGEEGRPP